MLEVSDLAITYGRGSSAAHAVRGVTFTVAPGETLAIVGESGCGKSSTGRLISGLESPTGGTVTVEGHDIGQVATRPELRNLVQMVFQHSDQALDRSWNVGRIVAEPLARRMRGAERRAAVVAALEDVGLDDSYLERFARDLSGGQAQRVAIARALVADPAYVVLDEPTASLDQSVRSRTIRLLQRLQAEKGIGYVFISHDLHSVRKLAHRVVVMYLGKIVEEGPVDEVFARPAHPYTRALLAAEPPIEPEHRWEIVPLPGETPSASRIPDGCTFRTRCRFAVEACAVAEPARTAWTAPGRSASCIRIEEIE